MTPVQRRTVAIRRAQAIADATIETTETVVWMYTSREPTPVIIAYLAAREVYVRSVIQNRPPEYWLAEEER